MTNYLNHIVFGIRTGGRRSRRMKEGTGKSTELWIISNFRWIKLRTKIGLKEQNATLDWGIVHLLITDSIQQWKKL